MTTLHTIHNHSLALDDFSLADLEDDRRDLLILGFLAQKVQSVLTLLTSGQNDTFPAIYHIQEVEERLHRVVIYRGQELLTAHDLSFVGFLSKKRSVLSMSIVREITEVDKKLVMEMVGNPDLLSYSSLELSDGNWCNLVIFKRPEATRYLEKAQTHRHAAYQLAPQYYEWIRLHQGVLVNGLAKGELVLLQTKYYAFEPFQMQPTIRERKYPSIHSSMCNLAEKEVLL